MSYDLIIHAILFVIGLSVGYKLAAAHYAGEAQAFAALSKPADPDKWPSHRSTRHNRQWPGAYIPPPDPMPPLPETPPPDPPPKDGWLG